MSSGAVFTPALVPVAGPAPRRPGDDPPVIRDGALAWRDGLITYAGPADALPYDLRAETHTSVEGAVLPGLVDCHTHLPFFGWRAEEFEARLAGRTYRDLHGGGGIFRSARLLASASDEEVLEFCRPLLAEMLAHGTTALELKTGYGLSVENELRQARLAKRLAAETPQICSVTLLACHATPPDRSRGDWVEEVCRELIPAAADEALADAVDVYVEDIAFTVEDFARVAVAAPDHGLAIRCHADQLGPSGAAEAAATVGARSADHLNHTSPEGVRALAAAETVAVLLPVSTLFLRGQPPPVAELIGAGASIALASDFNPGTSPCLSMPEVISVAASLYRVPTLACVASATINPAWVLGMHERLGSLEPGKRADFIVLDSEDVSMIPYRPGHNSVVETWIAGKRTFSVERPERGLDGFDQRA
jgi:imidazolonepropionase